MYVTKSSKVLNHSKKIMMIFDFWYVYGLDHVQAKHDKATFEGYCTGDFEP